MQLPGLDGLPCPHSHLPLAHITLRCYSILFLLAISGLVLASPALSIESPGPRDPFQPRTIESKSGRWSLHVDPGKESGFGPGVHTLNHDGEVVWRKAMPLTLRGTQLTDQGHVVALGWTEERVEEDGEHWFENEKHLIIIDSKGRIVADEINERLLLSPLLVQPRLDRVLVMTDDESEHEVRHWRTYKLSTGEYTGDWRTPYPFGIKEEGDLRTPATLRIMDVRPVPDTGLVLFHWWFSNYEHEAKSSNDAYSREGGVFTLVNPKGETVWSLERRTAYTIPNNETEDDKLESLVKSHSPLLSTSTEGRFTLWFPKQGMSTTFMAIQRQGTWKVIAQEPESCSLPKPAPGNPKEATPLPRVKLRLLSKTHLGEVPEPLPDPTVRDIWGFGFQVDGNLQFLRETNDAWEMVLLNAKGSEIRAIPLPLKDPTGEQLEWQSCQGDVWYASTSPLERTQDASLYKYEVAKGKLERVKGQNDFVFPDISRLIPTADGGVVFLGTYRHKYTSTDILAKCDRDGTILFNISDYSLSEQGLQYFTPNDFTITSQGLIAVLSHVGDEINILSPDGKFIRTFELEAAWKEKPHYPTDIRSDPEGNLWVADNGKLWHMNPEGQLLSTISPQLPSGSRFQQGDFQVAPDGMIWKTNQRLLASYLPSGERGLILGRLPKETSITEPGYGQIDPLGRILIGDLSNGSWHVFDTDGKWLHVCELPKEAETEDNPRVGVDPEGRVYIPILDLEYEHFFSYRFSPKGEPEKVVELASHRMRFTGGAGSYWADTVMNLELFDRNGNSHVSLRRRPDRDWWHDLWDYHVSHDGGTLAVLDADTLSFFDHQGKNGTQMTLPYELNSYQVAASQDWIVLAGWGGQVALLNRADQSIKVVETPPNKNGWRWGFSPSNTELWGVDIQALELYRYALPR